MHLEAQAISLTTGSGGAAVTECTRVLNGMVVEVRYTPDGSAPFDSSCTILITGETSGRIVLSLTTYNGGNTFESQPAVLAVKNDDGTSSAFYFRGVPMVNERVSVYVADAGNSKTGVFEIIAEGRFDPS